MPQTPPRILIVEDEMMVAFELEYILTDLGYEPVGIAADLAEAGRLAEDRIDLALVDLNLRDGLTGPQIGAMLSQRNVAVLFMTANPRLLGDGVAGTIGVLTKPTDEQVVAAAIAYALDRRAGHAVAPPAQLQLFG